MEARERYSKPILARIRRAVKDSGGELMVLMTGPAFSGTGYVSQGGRDVAVFDFDFTNSGYRLELRENVKTRSRIIAYSNYSDRGEFDDLLRRIDEVLTSK